MTPAIQQSVEFDVSPETLSGYTVKATRPSHRASPAKRTHTSKTGLCVGHPGPPATPG